MRYETDTHRADERQVADTLETAWGCTLTRLPPLAPVDYFAERGDALVALVEIKCRARAFDDYPVIWIDAHKWWAMRDAARGCHTRPLFVVRCGAEIVWCDLDVVDSLTTTVDGRNDRDDPNDRDLILCIPKGQFSRV